MQTIVIKKMYSSVASVIFAGLSLLAFGSHAQSDPAPFKLTDPIPVGPQVKVGTLPNGLTYYLQKNTKPEKRVELRLVVKAGSMQEDDDQQGLAHFVEHMAFNGSTHFKKHELISYLQSIGIKFGADLNAYTSFDETVYILPIPTDNRDNLKVGFDILSDWAQGVTLTDADIDKERGIILEEARLGKGASDRINKVLLPEVFNGSRYAQRLPIGKEGIIENFSYEALKRYYKDWYRPDLMAVIVVGDIDTADAEKMVKEHFAGLQNPKNERPRVYAPILARTGSNGVIAVDKELTDETVSIYSQIHEKKVKKVISDFRTELINSLTIMLLNKRVQSLAIRSQPKFQRANSSIVPIGSGYEVFRSHIVLGKLELESAVVALVEEIERARQLGFTKSELELSKKAYLSLMQQKYSERDKTISSVFSQKYILHFLMHDAIPSIENELSYVSEFLPTITIDEINQAAQKIIPHMEQKLVVYAGNEDPYLFLPNPQYLVTVAEKGEQFNFLLNKDIFTTKEKNITNQIKIVNPNQGQIISDIENLKLGIHELILSNGIKVILKSTDFQNDQILMRASRFGGQSLYDEQDTYNARYANTIVSQLGWKGLSAGHINETFAGHVFSVSSNLDLYTEGISASTRGEDMEQMFQVVNLHFALPSIDKPIFNGLITNWQVAAKSNLANPIDVYRNTVLTETYQHHSRALHFPKPEDFAKVDIWRATEIFHERFGSAKDFVFTIVGNFSIEKIKPFIATYIASLPTTDVVTNYRDLGIRPATGIIKKEILKGLDPVSNVFIGFSGDSIYSNIDNIQFLALLDVFELIINQALREKLGLIYTYGVRGELSRVPNSNFKIGMAIPCKPENVDRVIQEIFSEIKKIQGNGPEQTDLEKVRENWRKQHQIDVRTNQYWLDNLQDAALYRTDPEEILEAEKRIQALDQAGIQAAAKKYFNTQNYVQVVLYPEKN